MHMKYYMVQESANAHDVLHGTREVYARKDKSMTCGG